MTEQNDNNLEVPEELESINHQPETESPSKATPPVYKQSGMIAAIVMVVLALVLFLIWFIQGKKNSCH